jgi:hypothetical protein
MLHTPVFQFNHGDHICVFYRSEEALLNVLTPYVAEGLRKGEKCFLVQKKRVFKKLLYGLQFIGVDADAEIDRGAIEFHSESDAYLPNGKFEPADMMKMLTLAIADALQQGFIGFRSAGELSWAVEGRNACDQLLAYEEMVKAAYPGKPATGMCQYPIEVFPPDVLTKVLEAHKLSVIDHAAPSLFASIGINYLSYSAEIVADKHVLAPTYSYVVERRYPSEILGWGVAPDFESAKTKVEEVLSIG